MRNQAVEPPQNYGLKYLVVKRKNLPCFIFILKIQLVNRGKIIRANVSGRKSSNLSNEKNPHHQNYPTEKAPICQVAKKPSLDDSWLPITYKYQ